MTLSAIRRRRSNLLWCSLIGCLSVYKYVVTSVQFNTEYATAVVSCTSSSTYLFAKFYWFVHNVLLRGCTRGLSHTDILDNHSPPPLLTYLAYFVGVCRLGKPGVRCASSVACGQRLGWGGVCDLLETQEICTPCCCGLTSNKCIFSPK